MSIKKSPNCRRKKRVDERNKDPQNNQKIIGKMAVINPYLSVVSLNVNGLSSLNKVHRMAKWIF